MSLLGTFQPTALVLQYQYWRILCFLSLYYFILLFFFYKQFTIFFYISKWKNQIKEINDILGGHDKSCCGPHHTIWTKIQRIQRHMVKVGRAQKQIPYKNFDVTDNINALHFKFICFTCSFRKISFFLYQFFFNSNFLHDMLKFTILKNSLIH